MDFERLVENFSRDIEGLNEWWSIARNVLEGFVVPYLRENEAKIDRNHLLRMLEEWQLSLSNRHIAERLYYWWHRIEECLEVLPYDVMRLADIYLQAADPEYRALCGDSIPERVGAIVLGDIRVCGTTRLMVRWWIPADVATDMNIEELLIFFWLVDGLIVVGDKEKEQSVRHYLDFFGYRYVMREVPRGIMFLARKSPDFMIWIAEYEVPKDTAWESAVRGHVEKHPRGLILALKERKEELIRILEESSAEFKVEEYKSKYNLNDWVAVSYQIDRSGGSANEN